MTTTAERHQLIRAYLIAHPTSQYQGPPTYQDIADNTGLPKTTVKGCIQDMIRQGKLRRHGPQQRPCFEVVDTPK